MLGSPLSTAHPKAREPKHRDETSKFLRDEENLSTQLGAQGCPVAGAP